jgi:hypothetical protein
MINERGRHIWQRTALSVATFATHRLRDWFVSESEGRLITQATTDMTSTILRAQIMMRLRRAIETAGSSHGSVIASDMRFVVDDKPRRPPQSSFCVRPIGAIQAAARVVTGGGSSE